MSKLAQDMADLTPHLGHGQFCVVGHDRGQLRGLPAAPDHPARVTRLVFLGHAPIVEALEQANERFARL